MIRATRLLESRRVLSETVSGPAGTWSERTALTLVLEADGVLGLGEAAPLPGYSPDTVDEARAALQALLGHGFAEVEPGPALVDGLRAASAGIPSASARAAFEAALVDLGARRLAQPAWVLLGARDQGALPLSLWLPAEPARAVAAARRARDAGVRSFKVKVEAGADAGFATLRALRDELGDTVTLRADANQSFSVAELERRAPELEALGLEWLEEPLSGEQRLPASLRGSPGLTLALDESLQSHEPDLSVAGAGGVRAVVLKPTALGGLARSLELARAAAGAGLAGVASHCLEGPLGYMAAASLALVLGPRVAHGLAPHAGLGGWRPPALAPASDEVVPWAAAGFGISLGDALAGAETTRDERA